MQNESEEGGINARKPPPGVAPPPNVIRDLGSVKQTATPKRPPGGPPQSYAQPKPPGKAPPPMENKSGGRQAPKLPGPGFAPPKRSAEDMEAQSKPTSEQQQQFVAQSPTKRRAPPPPAGSPAVDPLTQEGSPSTPTPSSKKPPPSTEKKTPGRSGRPPPQRPGAGKKGAPPTPTSRVAPPYRAPPGAPPGKAPPRQPNLAGSVKVDAKNAAGLGEDSALAVSSPPPRRPKPTDPIPLESPFPKGRRPPEGLPPGKKPPPPKGKPKTVNLIEQAPKEAFPELEGLESIPAPTGDPLLSAPPPPDEPPPAIDEAEEIGPPRGAPPPLGKDAMPDPPEEMEEMERQIAEKLKRGRLSVKCIQAANIRRKDQNSSGTKIDAYLVLQLGDFKKAPRLKTQIRKRSGQNPQFMNETVSFDLVNPKEFVRNNDIKLTIELWDSNAWDDDCLGTVTLSAVRFLSILEAQNEWLPLTYPGDESSNSKVQVEFNFEQAKVGMAVFTLYEGRGLGSSEMKLGGNSLAPYVSVSVGETYHKRSQTILDGGTEPYFGEEQILMWVDNENWVEPAVTTVWHEDIGDHDLVGKADFSLLPYMIVPPDKAKQEIMPITVAKETTHDGIKHINTGELVMKCEFLESGNLTMNVKAARNLRDTESIGRLDPYLVLKSEGFAVKINKRTTVDKDGGINPEWNQVIQMDVVDHFKVEIECYDHDVLAATDELIGKTSVSLLPVYKKGHIDTWVTLKHKNEYNVLKDAGQVHIIFDFKAEHGIAYPQHQPAMDSFDDSQRIDYEKQVKMEEARRLEAEQNIISAVPGEEKKEEGGGNMEMAQDILQTAVTSSKYECGFNDDEIRAAFDFIDLDHNDYVGAAEIRHVLVCMGELVTDEEVDMMITMVDSDGDGQVGFNEFYMMVTDVDPARPDFGKADDQDANKPEDTKAAERQREMAARDMKRRMLSQFVSENQIGPTEIGFAWEKYSHFPPERTASGEIDFEMFCELLQVEPTGEYHKLFGLFDGDGSGDVSIKEFILGLCNFVDMDNDKRCRFIFDLFDDDHSGFLAQTELEDILMANHMQSRKACSRKAQTIMRAADIDGSGAISLAEFIVCSAKFPNILFPNQRDNQ